MLNSWLNVQGPSMLLLCSGNMCQIALLHVHRLEPGHKKMIGSSNAEEINSSKIFLSFFLFLGGWGWGGITFMKL